MGRETAADAGRTPLYAGIGAGIENTPAGMQSQVLLAADRIAMIILRMATQSRCLLVRRSDIMNEVFLNI
nr:DUF1983 domain-containing protein [Escherichia coli]